MWYVARLFLRIQGKCNTLQNFKRFWQDPNKEKNYFSTRVLLVVTISAKRLTEARGGGTRTVNIIRDSDLHGPSSFSLQGSQSQGGGTVS